MSDQWLTPQKRLPVGIFLLAGGIIGIVSLGTVFLGIAVSLIGLLILFSHFAAKIEANSNVALTSEKDELKEIKRYISKTQYLEHVDSLGEQTASLVGQISDRFKKFQDLLLLKFNPEELTYGRYYTAAETAYYSVLDTLKHVATLLNNLSAIDPKYLEQRIKELSSAADANSDLPALEERRQLRQNQLTQAKELLVFVEKAMTDFDRISTALADVQTRQGISPASLESALVDLTELAHRAKRYSVKNNE